MAVTSLSIILTVIVLNLHHARPHQRVLPNWVRYLVLHVIARIVRCKCGPKMNRQRQKQEANSTDQKETSLRLANDVTRHSPVTELRASRLLRRADQSNDYCVYPESGSDSRRQALMEDMLRCIKKMVARRDQEDQDEATVTEWQDVAAVFDRLLFIFCLIVTVLTTLILILIIPYSQYKRRGGGDGL